MIFSSGLARGVVLTSEEFSSWPTDWTQEIIGSPIVDATIKHDAINGRMEIEHPANFGAQIGSVHDLFAAHKGDLVNPGDRLVYTIDFELESTDFVSLEFGLMDDTENTPPNNNVEKYQYRVSDGAVTQLEGGSLSDSVSAMLSAGTAYTAVLDIMYDGVSTLSSSFTINGEEFNSSRSVSGPMTLHMHFETFSVAGGFIPIDVYVDRATLEFFTAPVPEPASTVCLMLSGSLWGLRRRR